MGNIACCEYEVPTLTLPILKDPPPDPRLPLAKLKEKLEGFRRKLKDTPQVWLTINEITFQEDKLASLSPLKFSLQGAALRCTAEIVGSNKNIVQELGSEAALKLMDKVGVGSVSKKLATELLGRAGGSTQTEAQKAALTAGTTSLIQVKEKPHELPDRVGVGAGSWDKDTQTKVIELLAVANVVREMSETQVRVEVCKLEAMAPSGKISLATSDSLRRHIQEAVSKGTFELLEAKEGVPVAAA